MSTEKNQGIPSGYTEEEINEMAEEAIKEGTMMEVDLLGNTEPYKPEADDIMNEIVTGDENDLPVSRVLAVVRHLQGRVLTIVDASYDNETRAKFVKDLVKDAFSSSASWIYEMSIREFENLKPEKEEVSA